MTRNNEPQSTPSLGPAAADAGKAHDSHRPVRFNKDGSVRRLPGPRSQLTEKRKSDICAIIAVGGLRVTAANYVGCSVNTIKSWLRKDVDFRNRVRQAEVQQEVALLQRIENASKEAVYWRAAAWLLERRAPERYGLRNPQLMTREQVAGALQQFAEVLMAGISNADERSQVAVRVQDLTLALADETEQGRRR